MTHIDIVVAFLAGLFSVASPCVLPILPSFLGYVSGISFAEQQNRSSGRLRFKLFFHTLLFCIGFSIIFLVIGGVIGFLGEAFLLHRPIFQQIGGFIIILFGLQLTQIIQIKTLLKERKLKIPSALEKLGKHFSYLRSFLIGVIFAFGWAPCYGPIVGTILTLVATSATFYSAIFFFIFYSLGFLLPFLVMGLFIGQITLWLKKFKKAVRYFSIIAGILVIILGVLLMTNNLWGLVNFFNIVYNERGIYFP